MNGFNVNEANKNPWEYFFYQPFGYRLNTIKNTKKAQYFECKSDILRPNENIFDNKKINNFGTICQNVFTNKKRNAI